jgi:hypothetical protein
MHVSCTRLKDHINALCDHVPLGSSRIWNKKATSNRVEKILLSRENSEQFEKKFLCGDCDLRQIYFMH